MLTDTTGIEEGLTTLLRTERMGVLLALVVVLLGVLPARSALAQAERPPKAPAKSFGAYTEPAPNPQSEQRARKFVNKMLKQEGARKRVSVAELRAGVALQAPPIAPSPATKRTPGPTAEPPRTTARPQNRSSTRGPVRVDLGPAERAGVSAPASQHVPSTTIGLVLAAVLAAVAIAVSMGGRALVRSTSHERHEYSPPS
jgi:hypothetical protein